MNSRNLERSLIDGAAGTIETVIAVPETAPRGIALVTHPHPLQGGTLDNKVTTTLARTFFALGYAAIRFNFCGVGRSSGTFDEGLGETEDALTVLTRMRERFGAGLPIALAGFSFGSFVQTRVAQRVVPEGLVLVGAAVKRFELAPVPKTTIVIHGEQDDVVPLADVFDWARPQQVPVVVFPGCGHFFHGRIVQLAQVVAAMWPQRDAPGAYASA
ncbi:MAG: alpha/beta hydrolase [Casimicrobiaceae bacterium]